MRRLLVAVLLTALAIPAAVLADATAPNQDAAHSGVADGPAPPLGKRWEVDLRTSVGTPLVADGRVYVITGSSSSSSSSTAETQQLRALSLDSGAELWARAVPGARPNDLAFDSGRVVVLERGALRGYDAASGNLAWTLRPQGESSSSSSSDGPRFTSNPVALGGEAYIVGTTPPAPPAPADPLPVPGGGSSGSSSEYSLYTVRLADGAVVRTSPSSGSGDSSARHGVAADADRVYVSDGCAHAQAFDRRGGGSRWAQRPPGSDSSSSSSFCGGYGAPRPPVAGNGEVLISSGPSQYTVRDAAGGADRGAVVAHSAPALPSGLALLPQSSELLAQARPGGLTRWSWRPPGQGSEGPAGSPLVAGGAAYVRQGRFVVGLSLANGAEIWRGYVRYMYASGSDSSSNGVPAMAAGGGQLVVPYGSILTSFHNGPDRPGLSTRPPLGGDASDRMTLATTRKAVLYGGRVTLSGRFPYVSSSGPAGAGHDVHLEQDPWPFDGSFQRVATVRASSRGEYTYPAIRPERNTRYRVVDDVYADAVSAPVEVQSDYAMIFRRVRWRGNRLMSGVRIVHSPQKRMAGRKLHVYLVRGRRAVRRATRTLRRVRRYEARASFSYRIARPRRGDRTFVCVPEKVDDGYGRVFRVDRLCGRRVIARRSLPR